MNNIGIRIRNLREAQGMTQEELAHKVGYKSRVSINKIELSRDVPLKKLAPIAEALGTTPAELAGWNEENENNQYDLMPDEKELIEAWRDADLETKGMIIRILAFNKTQGDK